MNDTEQIIFVNKDGTPTGEVGPKLASHNANTKLHLAFSCYIFQEGSEKFLLTQRALSKKVWPGVWTNSVCGHPAPNEKMEDAIRRRVLYEVGIEHLVDLQCVVANYTYITPPYKGIVEHEFCPIFIAHTSDAVRPNPKEVEAYEWLSWSAYAHKLDAEADIMSYWAKDEYKHLKELPYFKTLFQR